MIYRGETQYEDVSERNVALVSTDILVLVVSIDSTDEPACLFFLALHSECNCVSSRWKGGLQLRYDSEYLLLVVAM